MSKYGKKHKSKKEHKIKDATIEEVNEKEDISSVEDKKSEKEQELAKAKDSDIKSESKEVAQPEKDSDQTSEESSESKRQRKYIQNLVSVIILLAGLLLGSVLVDIAQLVTGQGFSQKAINNADVFEVDGRTWVAFEEPIVDLAVVTDEECEECQPDEALVFLRRYLPTIFTKKVDINSAQGERMVQEFNIKTIPAFIFDSSVEEASFYFQAEPLFERQGEQFVLNTAQLGLPVGKYLELPNVNEDSIRIGSQEAPIQVVEFSDFQCPFCKAIHPTIIKVMQEFGEETVQYVYKHLPLGFHGQAENSALASECAHEQEKFIEYADLLFAKQEQWGQSQGTALFKQYARQLGLKSQQFNQCLDSKKYQGKIEADMAEAQEFGLTGTPSTFINGEFLSGAADYESLKAIIENQLSSEEGVEANEEGDEEKMDETENKNAA